MATHFSTGPRPRAEALMRRAFAKPVAPVIAVARGLSLA